jgi:hypothetical protein
MPKVTNITFHKDCEWDTYCKLPGHSFSSLKNEDKLFVETEGSRIGKQVHTYILKPAEYDFQDADIVVPIARELVKFLGPHILQMLVPECGITANFEHEGFSLPWRGMPDLHKRKVIVVDFKIIKGGSLREYVKQFKYEDQVRGYMLPVEASTGLIVAYNRAKRIVETHLVKQDHSYWDYVVKQKGEYLCASM